MEQNLTGQPAASYQPGSRPRPGGDRRWVGSGEPAGQRRPAFSVPTVDRKRLWVIVLAGGEGERLRPLTENWLGWHCPKQYCTFVGSRSMLQHTLDRACQVVEADQVLTVVGSDHLKWLQESSGREIRGQLLVQPSNLDTGPGVFLPAVYILAADPSAVVLIFPSDHFVYPENTFVSKVRRLAAMAQKFKNRIVTLAAEPNRPEADYGWIKPGQVLNSDSLIPGSKEEPVREVIAFKEKPSVAEAEDYFRKGYLWNTMIMAVNIQTLWNLGKKFLPSVAETLGAFADPMRNSVARLPELEPMNSKLRHAYTSLKPENFSKSLLERSAEQTVVATMDDVLWDDWGRPNRIVESLEHIGRRPAFLGGQT